MIGALALRALVALGRVDEARAELDRAAAHRFADVPDDFVRLGTLASFARIAHDLGDGPRAEAVGRLLANHLDANVMLGTSQCLGASERFVALTALAAGDAGAAVRLAAEACARNTRMGFHPWAARARWDLARAFRARGEGGDATKEADQAKSEAERLGMVTLAREIETFVRAPTRRPERSVEIATFVHEGDVVQATTRTRPCDCERSSASGTC